MAEAVGDVLKRVLGQLGLARELGGWEAVRAWPEVVGPRVAQHTRCVDQRDGVLRVEVDGAAWMQELRYLERDLIRNINRRLGAERIRGVRFVVPREGILR
jgi:predicted nucleic acid-binding Zn ribbon protein